MKRWGIAVAMAGLLLFSAAAWADEPAMHDGHSSGGHGAAHVEQAPVKQQEGKAAEMNMNDAKPHNMTPEEHKNMDMGNSHDMHGMSHDSQPSGGSHSHGGNAEVAETPPNIPVLSTFAGIILAFILYGAWNKWLRKKERARA